MSTYDGERFIFGDDNLTRPGRPVDTLLENIMRSQQIYLMRHRGNRVGHCRRRAASGGLVNYLGDKTYASLHRVCFFSRLMWVCPNIKELSLFFTARVGTEAPSNPATKVEMWFELEGFGPPQGVVWETGPRYQEYELKFSFDEVAPPTRPVLVQMRLWMKSEVVAKDGSALLASNIRRYPGEVQVSGLYPMPSFPGPNAGTQHERFTEAGDSERIDHLVQLGTDSMIVYPPEPQGGGSYRTGWLSYLQIKGLFYEEEYTPAVPPQEDFRAGIPITGQHVLGHAQRLHEVHTRPRLLDFGHQGERVDLAEVWHYHEESQYLRSESGYPWRPVLRAPVILDEPAPRLEVCMLALPYQLLKAYTQGTSLARLAEDGAIVTWEIKAELVKYAISPAETVLMSQTQTVVFKHLPTDGSGRWPALTQLKWREFGADGPRHPTLKEGLLYEVDQVLITRLNLSFDGSAITEAMLAEPLSLRLSMRQAEDAVFSTTEPELGADPHNLALMLTGLTVWAHHD